MSRYFRTTMRFPAPPQLVRVYEEWQQRNRERYGRKSPSPAPSGGGCSEKIIMERGARRVRVKLPDRFFWEGDELLFDEEGLGGAEIGTETWAEDTGARQQEQVTVAGVTYSRTTRATFVRPNGDRITLAFGGF